MPLVVVEGPDGAGKSTLATRLLKRTGLPTLLVKRSGPPGDVETLLLQSRWIKEQGESPLNILCDRHPIISECIYRPVVRREGPAPWTVEDAAPALTRRDVLLIYCRPTYETLSRTVGVEEQMAGVTDHYVELLAEYDRWFHRLEDLGANVFRYDFRNTALGEVTALVRDHWMRRNR
jgi:hypothetical protein